MAKSGKSRSGIGRNQMIGVGKAPKGEEIVWRDKTLSEVMADCYRAKLVPPDDFLAKARKEVPVKLAHIYVLSGAKKLPGGVKRAAIAELRSNGEAAPEWLLPYIGRTTKWELKKTAATAQKVAA